MDYNLILKAKCILMAICIFSAIPSAYSKEWSQQEKILRFTSQPAFHWGQPGQDHPNNGWSDYSKVILDLGGDVIIEAQRNRPNEISMKIISKESNDLEYQYIYSFDAGIISFPIDKTECTIDGIEMAGLYVELAMYMLSQAFPNGPQNISSDISKSFRYPKAEIRFMGGVMRQKRGGFGKAGIRKIGKSHFEIEVPKESIKLEWIGEQIPPSPNDDEQLSAWRICSDKIGSPKSFKEVRLFTHKQVMNNTARE